MESTQNVESTGDVIKYFTQPSKECFGLEQFFINRIPNPDNNYRADFYFNNNAHVSSDYFIFNTVSNPIIEPVYHSGFHKNVCYTTSLQDVMDLAACDDRRISILI